MTDETPQQMPPIKETRYINANIIVGDPDEAGNREITFPVGGLELMTFVVAPEAQKFVVKRFTGGIDIAGPGDLPPDPADAERG